MTDSILDTIKPMLGISPSNTVFDVTIIPHINSTLSILCQMGVGPVEGYRITSNSNIWSELIINKTNSDLVITYIWAKVKMMFDPPTSSAAIDALNRTITELEWRINNL